MERERVSGSVNTDGLHAEGRRGARYADRNFTSVGNQYALEQKSKLPDSILKISTGWPLSVLQIVRPSLIATISRGRMQEIEYPQRSHICKAGTAATAE
jgi:hypothetical protein